MNSGNAGRAESIRCEEFLSSHSDYLDGMLSPLTAAQLCAHMQSCSSCARYDRIVRKSLILVHELPDLAPSDDFELRLQHRIFHVEDEAALAQRPGVGVAAALAVAAMIALLAWSPMMVQRTTNGARSAQLIEPAFQPLGLNTPSTGAASWYTTIPVGTPATPEGIARLINSPAIAPGPYNPLVVHPPVRAIRTVSRSSPE